MCGVGACGEGELGRDIISSSSAASWQGATTQRMLGLGLGGFGSGIWWAKLLSFRPQTHVYNTHSTTYAFIHPSQPSFLIIVRSDIMVGTHIGILERSPFILG